MTLSPWSWLRSRLGLGHNPLRRSSDYGEAVAFGAAGVFGCPGLFTAVLAALVTGQVRHDLRDHELATRNQVRAIVVAVQPVSGWLAPSETLAWRDLAGHAHRATSNTGPEAEVGHHETMWVDSAQHVTARPITAAEVVTDSLGMGLAVLFAACLFALAGFWLVRRRLYIVRFRDLDAEWAHLNRISRWPNPGLQH